MKFFKHFTDAHRGKSLQLLADKHGMKIIGVYWTLVELCAEKMKKNEDEEYTEEHCRFTFSRCYIRDTLKAHQFRTLEMWLRCLEDVGLMSHKCGTDVIEIYMPKLLECLDRDAKRARAERGPSAPKNKREEKEEEKDINIGPGFDFDTLWQAYPKAGRVNKAEGFRRLAEQVKTLDQYLKIKIAIENNVRFLNLPANKDWRKPKQFDVFIGPKSAKVKPWEEWVNPDPGLFEEEKSGVFNIAELIQKRGLV